MLNNLIFETFFRNMKGITGWLKFLDFQRRMTKIFIFFIDFKVNFVKYSGQWDRLHKWKFLSMIDLMTYSSGVCVDHF